jgi:hypothetical protein
VAIPRIPLFQTPQEIGALLQSWRRSSPVAHRAGGTPAATDTTKPETQETGS